MSWSAFIDGGSRGNPGPSGAGVLIRDDASNVVLAAGFFLGRRTNNQAEYRAMLTALDLLERAGADAITLTSDSELLVRQINGQYRVKSAELKPLYRDVMDRLARFGRWTVQHTLREGNTDADGLANLAMDRKADVVRTDTLKLTGTPTTRSPDAGSASAPERSTGATAIEIVVRRAPAKGACSAGLRRGQRFVVTATLPGGLCIDAASGLIEAVLALRDLGDAGADSRPVLTPECPRAGCGARFEVRFQDDTGED